MTDTEKSVRAAIQMVGGSVDNLGSGKIRLDIPAHELVFSGGNKGNWFHTVSVGSWEHAEQMLQTDHTKWGLRVAYSFNNTQLSLAS